MATKSKKSAPVVHKAPEAPNKTALPRRRIVYAKPGSEDVHPDKKPAQRPMPRPSLSSGEQVSLEQLCSDMEHWLKDSELATPVMRQHVRDSVATSVGLGMVDTQLQGEELTARIAELLKD
jgi:hypothetical protein